MGFHTASFQLCAAVIIDVLRHCFSTVTVDQSIAWPLHATTFDAHGDIINSNTVPPLWLWPPNPTQQQQAGHGVDHFLLQSNKPWSCCCHCLSTKQKQWEPWSLINNGRYEETWILNIIVLERVGVAYIQRILYFMLTILFVLLDWICTDVIIMWELGYWDIVILLIQI